MSQPTSVTEWLMAVGLVEYAACFARNDVDVSVLPHLTDLDLKEIGVASLGHRRRLLADIAELPRADARPGCKPQIEAERRHLSVMFCDLVGSTALSRADWESLAQRHNGAFHPQATSPSVDLTTSRPPVLRSALERSSARCWSSPFKGSEPLASRVRG